MVEPLQGRYGHKEGETAMRCILLAALFVLAITTASRAEITFMIPFPPGTTSHLLVQRILEPLERELDEKISIVNYSAREGVAGTAEAMNAPPDGKTLVVGTIGPLVHLELRDKYRLYDESSMTPISMLGNYCYAIVVPGESNIKSWGDLVTRMRDGGTTLRFGKGTFSADTIGRMLRAYTGAPLEIYAAQNENIVRTQLLSKNFDVAVMSLGPILKLIDDGTIRPIATVHERCGRIPETPTFAEAGWTDFPSDVFIWAAVYAAGKISRDAQDRLNRAFVRVLGSDDVRKDLEALGFNPRSSTPEWLFQFRRDQVKRWRDITKNMRFGP